MSRLLDREMPVAAPRRKRRIAGWWWLFAGLGLGAGIAAVWFSSIQEPVPPPPIERPVAQTHNRGQEQLPAPAVENAGTTGPAATPPPPALTAPIAATADRPGGAIHSVSPEKSTPANVENSPLPAAATPPATANDTKAENRPPFPISGLASLPLTPLPERQPGLNLATPDRPGSKSRPQFLAYASALTSPVSGSNGLAGGVLASFRLKNPRLSLEAGLGYTYIRQPLSIFAPDDAANLGAGENQQVIYGFENLDEKATRFESNYLLATQDLGLHYAEVPVHLAFMASPRWQFFAGANILVLLESAPGFTGGGLLDDARQMDVANGDLYASGISSSTLLVPLSKIDAQLSAGVRYRLGRSLSLGLQYQTGTVDVVKSNGADDYHRLLRLSLFHHFGR
jgi:hypothetical protein